MRNMLSQKRVIKILKKELPSLTIEYGVKKIAIFGSYAKGTQTKKSDIDILVDLNKPRKIEIDFGIPFGMPTDSPLRKLVNSALLKIMNEPLWDFLLDRYGFKENFDGKPITLGKKKY